jgi:Putative auto-transporter adhesin, head GIN domain
MRGHPRLPIAVLAVMLLGTSGAQHANGDEAHTAGALIERTEQVAAEGLVIDGLAATLTIEGEPRDDVSLTMRGTEGALGQIEHEIRGGVLHIGMQGSFTSLTGGGQNVVIARNGGRATSIIGGQEVTVSSLEAEPMPEIRVALPGTAPIALAGLVGEIEVKGVEGPIELALSQGEAHLDRVRDGRLAISGDGTIEVDRASGDLVVEVQGAGRARIADALLDELKVEITGTGEVVVDGVAEEGRLSVAGIGRIRVSEIRSEPEISRSGLGDIQIGNR